MQKLLSKSYYITCIYSMICFMVNAQDVHVSTTDPAQMAVINLDPSKDVFTMSGSRISSSDLSEVKGSPYLFPRYVKGQVVFVNGQTYNDALLQFNLATNQLQFLDSGRPMAFAQQVRSFSLIDTTGGITKSALFNSGYPDFGKHTINTFYQVLAFGSRIQLIKYISKHTSEQYQYSTVPKLFFKTSEDLFVYDQQSQEMRFINYSAASVKKALEKINPQARQLVEATGKKKFTEEEIIALVQKVNEL